MQQEQNNRYLPTLTIIKVHEFRILKIYDFLRHEKQKCQAIICN